MGNAIHQAVLQACRNFMIPIARFLLRNGITFKEFAEVAKWAFVHVATEEYGIRGRKTNISRVSVMTGLSRKDVSKSRSDSFVSLLDSAEWSVPSKVLQQWYLVDEYHLPTGLPRSLAKTEFSRLVRSISRNVSVASVRQELLRAGSLTEEASGSLRPLGRYYVPHSQDLRAIEYVGLAIHNLASTLDKNIAAARPADRYFERSSFSRSLPHALVSDFMCEFRESAERLLAEADNWMAKRERKHDGDSLTGLGVYFFRDYPHQPSYMRG